MNVKHSCFIWFVRPVNFSLFCSLQRLEKPRNKFVSESDPLSCRLVDCFMLSAILPFLCGFTPFPLWFPRIVPLPALYIYIFLSVSVSSLCTFQWFRFPDNVFLLQFIPLLLTQTIFLQDLQLISASQQPCKEWRPNDNKTFIENVWFRNYLELKFGFNPRERDKRLSSYLISCLLASRSPNTYSFLGGLYITYTNNTQSIYIRW